MLLQKMQHAKMLLKKKQYSNAILQKKQYGKPDMITLPFKISPFYSTVFAVQRIISALVPTLSIFVTAHFINTAIAILNKTSNLSAIRFPIFLLTAIMVYNVLIWVLMNFVNCRADIYYRKRLRPEMIAKRARLEYRYIEEQKTADLINRVCPKIDTTIKEMYTQVLDVVEVSIFVVGIIITLFTQVWWVALLIVVSSVPIMIVATKAGKRSYEADKEMSRIDRRAEYLSQVLKSREAVEERSIYGYSEKLNQVYGERYDYARKFRLKVTRSNFIKQKMGGIVLTFVSVITMLAMLQPAAQGSIDIGMFIALMNAVFELSLRLSWGVNWHIEQLSRKREFLKDLSEFMALDENEDATVLPKEDMAFRRIEFRDVSFKYPGTEKLILDKVSFVIENGKHYSFVGVNGAGKTTITKLITGLYTNYEGDILVDGRPLRDFTQAEIKGLSSVVYQDFARYYISMHDNIAIANPGKQDIKKDAEEDFKEEVKKHVKEAAELAGLSDTISKLPDGIDTPLGKIQEKGVDISGGEWQRVAMARGILSPAPLRILDEPTASLDPISESMVYKKFEQISRGMTTIFISHRLGSTKLADIIYVLSDGKIVESGSHDELMERNGTYAEMYRAQAEWYSNNGSAGVSNGTDIRNNGSGGLTYNPATLDNRAYETSNESIGLNNAAKGLSDGEEAVADA